MSYLSEVDEYVPESFRSSTGGVSYQRGTGGEWTAVSDGDFASGESVCLVPLRFRRGANVPEIGHAGPTANQRVLIVAPNRVDAELQAMDKIRNGGTTWKARHSNKITRYIEYGRASVGKVQRLIQGAESFDIILITSAYIAMWYTLGKVFVDMRAYGSRFWLAFGTLVQSTFAFLLALSFTSKVLDRKVSMLSLSEGIPFLVAIIGFKHKVSIGGYVMRLSVQANGALVGKDGAIVGTETIIAEAVGAHTVSLLRDHCVVAGALAAIGWYAAHLQGLANFCVLAATILTFDLVLVCTFYAAVLALKVEINRARRTQDLRMVLEEDGISEKVAADVASPEGRASRSALKVASLGVFFGCHALWLGSSWMYSDAGDGVGSVPPQILAVAEHLGRVRVVTVLPSVVYSPSGVLVEMEDSVLFLLTQVSHAIRDNIISKFLLFGFVLSVTINAYFLNSSRRQHERLAKMKKNEQREVIPSSTPSPSSSSSSFLEITPRRGVEECARILKEGNVKTLRDEEVAQLVGAGQLALHALERQLGDNERAVAVRRKAIAAIANAPVLDSGKLPYKHYDYDRVFGACCENVIGYMPLPVGVAGPLVIDGKPYHIPMATTEGCLVASTQRGCKAINAGGGVETVLTQDGMTRGPCVSFPTLKRAGAAKIWLDSEEGQRTIKKAFNSTSRFARLQHIKTALAGTLLFIRFRTTTGDAMGMNMISKGVEHSLKYMATEAGWSDMSVISVSGNYCTDKKPAAINWIEGRGKSIVAEARIPADVVRKVLKSDVDALVELNVSKNLVGSAMAGSVGGFNAHAANLVTAVFLACGQDPAQNVESSNCITLMNKLPDGSLGVSVSMPSIEVGTIGGGTVLEPQSAMLELLGVKGPHPTQPGENARQLAKIVASAVLAAELSLCSALAAGHLVQAHMAHNRVCIKS